MVVIGLELFVRQLILLKFNYIMNKLSFAIYVF